MIVRHIKLDGSSRKKKMAINFDDHLLENSNLKSEIPTEIYGGDDRIRTCGTLLEYNGLANRRFQPLSHVSNLGEKQGSILAHGQTLSRFNASYIADDGVIYRLTLLVFINKIAGL